MVSTPLEAWVRECWDRLYPPADWSGAESAVSVMAQEIERRRIEAGDAVLVPQGKRQVLRCTCASCRELQKEKDPIPDQSATIQEIAGAAKVIRGRLAQLITRQEALIADRNRLDAEIDTLETLYAELRYQLEHAEEANPCR